MKHILDYASTCSIRPSPQMLNNPGKCAQGPENRRLKRIHATTDAADLAGRRLSTILLDALSNRNCCGAKQK
eukprot:4912095-Amphidinium_carterae.1